MPWTPSPLVSPGNLHNVEIAALPASGRTVQWDRGTHDAEQPSPLIPESSHHPVQTLPALTPAPGPRLLPAPGALPVLAFRAGGVVARVAPAGRGPTRVHGAWCCHLGAAVSTAAGDAVAGVLSERLLLFLCISRAAWGCRAVGHRVPVFQASPLTWSWTCPARGCGQSSGLEHFPVRPGRSPWKGPLAERGGRAVSPPQAHTGGRPRPPTQTLSTCIQRVAVAVAQRSCASSCHPRDSPPVR
nr:uncharacterized protein LOC111763456 [Dasypus novemcinctus]